MAPLEQYVARLMPLRSAVHPAKPPPRLAPFDARALLRWLAKHQSGRRRQCREWGLCGGDSLGLYASFLKTATFRLWWATRRKEAAAHLADVYLRAVLDSDPAQWTRGLGELQIVDVLVRVRDAMKSSAACHVIDTRMRGALEAKLAAVVGSLPDDLQATLRIARQRGTA